MAVFDRFSFSREADDRMRDPRVAHGCGEGGEIGGENHGEDNEWVHDDDDDDEDDDDDDDDEEHDDDDGHDSGIWTREWKSASSTSGGNRLEHVGVTPPPIPPGAPPLPDSPSSGG